jgi:hypothetical protein
MKVLVACEFSGRVRDAFIRRGHDALSCDLMDTESPGPHYVGDVMDIIDDGWDLAIFHPPCTYLAVSGARWFSDPDRQACQREALEFVQLLMDAPIPKIAIENPVGVISTHIRKPDQYVQPWVFGDGETKKTGLWLKDLPLLEPDNIVEGRKPVVHNEPPGPDRWKNRSRTYPGIARAMAEQWGKA